MTRSSSKQSSSKKSVVPDKPQSQWVMIAEEKLLEQNSNEENKVSVCKLRHPKSDQAAMYLVCKGGETISEVVKFAPDYGSWLIGNTVQKDGSMMVTTPMDPMFLVLPYLINSGKSGKFMTLDQIVTDADFPDCVKLVDCPAMEGLDHVADMKGADDFKAYRYNSDKTLAWLKLKTQSVSEALRASDVRVSESGSHSASFVRSKKDLSDGEDAYIKYAHGLVSDYLPLDLATSLRDHLGIKETKENIKPETTEEPPNKKAKLSKDIAPSEDYSAGTQLKKDNSKGKQTIAQKKLSKVDKSGMKSISSFFSPKS